MGPSLRTWPMSNKKCWIILLARHRKRSLKQMTGTGESMRPPPLERLSFPRPRQAEALRFQPQLLLLCQRHPRRNNHLFRVLCPRHQRLLTWCLRHLLSNHLLSLYRKRKDNPTNLPSHKLHSHNLRSPNPHSHNPRFHSPPFPNLHSRHPLSLSRNPVLRNFRLTLPPVLIPAQDLLPGGARDCRAQNITFCCRGDRVAPTILETPKR